VSHRDGAERLDVDDPPPPEFVFLSIHLEQLHLLRGVSQCPSLRDREGTTRLCRGRQGRAALRLPAVTAIQDDVVRWVRVRLLGSNLALKPEYKRSVEGGVELSFLNGR